MSRKLPAVVTVALEVREFESPEHVSVGQRLMAGSPWILRSGRDAGTPYLFGEVIAVHCHGCAATRLGLKFGPCNCGAEKLLRDWLEGRR